MRTPEKMASVGASQLLQTGLATFQRSTRILTQVAPDVARIKISDPSISDLHLLAQLGIGAPASSARNIDAIFLERCFQQAHAISEPAILDLDLF